MLQKRPSFLLHRITSYNVCYTKLLRRAWGKAVSLGARVNQGQCIMELYVNSTHVDAAKKALKGACVKLPATPTIQVKEYGKMSP